jgi:hypothetical protein
MEFEKVINGIVKYFNKEIYVGMNDWQEVLARMAVSRLLGNTNTLKQNLANNAYIKTFGIMDDTGNIDVESLYIDLKKQIEAKGKITITLPMFGNFSFTPSDVDKLYQSIVGE